MFGSELLLNVFFEETGNGTVHRGRFLLNPSKVRSIWTVRVAHCCCFIFDDLTFLWKFLLSPKETVPIFLKDKY